MEQSSNAVISGREQRQELDLGLLKLVPASNPDLLAGSWVNALTQAGAVSQCAVFCRPLAVFINDIIPDLPDF